PDHEPTDDDLHVIDPDAVDTTVDEIRADSETDVVAVEDVAVEDVAVEDIVSEDVAVDESVDASDADAEVETSVEDAADDDSDVADSEVVSEVADDDDDDDDDDDVVVDLFARLRADATVEPTDDGLAAEGDGEPGVSLRDSHTQAPDATQTPDSEQDDAGQTADATDGEDADGEDGEEVEDTVFDRRDADLTPLIVSSARKLKRVLADEQNEVLDALRRNDPVRNLDALLPWTADHTERYASVISDDLLLAANAGAALADLDKTPKLRKAAGKQAVTDASEKLGQWLVQPLRDRLERCVTDGDGDNAAIAQKVRAVYRECKTRHIDEQLDDVIRVSHGRGLLGALALDTPVEWTTDPRHAVCADCDDNRLAGVVASGQPFPTGVVSTPAHPGCRCMLVPVAR
ncbi:MAG: hypothetical protein WA964_13135, partial [Ilumatobacter sp.]